MQYARSKLLEDAIPKLREIWLRQSNKDNVFPLFSERVHKGLWSRVKPQPRQRQAAVLVPLLCHKGVPSLMFTTRSSSMPTHAAEVSFPGGHYDASVDRHLEDTAIRETREELVSNADYPWEDLEIIGHATAVPSIKGTPVTPVLGVLPHDVTTSDIHDIFPGHPGEVENVFCVSLAELLQVETSQKSERFRANIPVFPTNDGHKIWGLTAVIVRPMLHKLLRPVFGLSGKQIHDSSTSLPISQPEQTFEEMASTSNGGAGTNERDQ